MNITSYGPKEITFTENNDYTKEEILESSVESIYNSLKHTITLEKCIADDTDYVTREKIMSPFGYEITKFTNTSKEYIYSENVKFPVNRGLRVCQQDQENEDENTYKVKIMPIPD